MLGFVKKKVNLGIVVNPFYSYCIAFSLSIFVYLLGWSNIFPKLSSNLLLFFASTIILFLLAGYLFLKKQNDFKSRQTFNPHLHDIIFSLIILLGIINVLYMGYVPVLDRNHNYREFGMPVIDPVFNTLCIFFSVIYFHSFLDTRKKRFLTYFIIILIIQIIIFRRATIIWIVISSVFLFILYKQKVSLLFIALGIIIILPASYFFGLYGNARSHLTKSFVLNDLGASDKFKNSGISYEHYMTYLYMSSPLANLQKNIDKREEGFKQEDLKEFLFYCLVPKSFTSRLEESLQLEPPACFLISPYLIVGSFYMESFYTMGWIGMIMMFLYLFSVILLCLLIIRKWHFFVFETLSLLSATASLLVFSNFLNRLDVMLMLLVYPVLFHFIYASYKNFNGFSFRVPIAHLKQ